MTRDEMLGRARRALHGAAVPPLPPLAAGADAGADLDRDRITPGSPSHGGDGSAFSTPARRSQSGTAESSLARFIAEARAVGSVVHVAPSLAAAADVVARVAAGAAADNGAPSGRPRHVIAWRTPIVTAVVESAQASMPALCVRFADDVDAAPGDAAIGITEVDALVAASGTLVLGAADERHRATSLLPRIHVALAPVERMVADLGAALRVVAAGPSGGPCTTLITGPSRTADIEKKLVLGVHGPCELHVVIIDAAAAEVDA